MSKWSLIAADLNGANLSELVDTRDVQISFGLNKPTQTSFTLPLKSPWANSILSGEALVKAYQHTTAGDKILRTIAEVVTVEETGSADGQQVIAVQCLEAGAFRLLHRLVGKSTSGYTVTTATDRGTIASDLIAAVNAITGTDGGGYTGVRIGSVTASSNTTVTPAWQYQSVLEAIALLGNDLDGYDWAITPIDAEVDAAGITIGEFTCAPAIGTVRDLYFEYGGGKRNVDSYSRKVIRENFATTIYALPTGYGDTDGGALGTVTIANSASPAITGTGRHEAVIADTITSDVLRASLAETLVGVRSIPQEILEFQPSPNLVEFGTDYGPGDVVYSRVKIEQDTRVDATVRIYGIDLSLDENGRETSTLTLTPETLSA